MPPEELEELDDDELELFPPEELDDELDELLDELDELLEDELLDELDDDAITPLPDAPADEEDSDDPPPPPQATNARGRLSINERNSRVRNKGIGENSRLGMAGAMVRR